MTEVQQNDAPDERDLEQMVVDELNMQVADFEKRHPAAAEILRRRSGALPQFVHEYLQTDAAKAMLEEQTNHALDTAATAKFIASLVFETVQKFLPMLTVL